MIMSDFSAEADSWLINNAIDKTRRGTGDVEGLGNVLQSAAGRGHTINIVGTYVSPGELVSIYMNGGIVNKNLLTYPQYGFTNQYPTKEGVSYNHFILYSDKVFLPIIEK